MHEITIPIAISSKPATSISLRYLRIDTLYLFEYKKYCWYNCHEDKIKPKKESLFLILNKWVEHGDVG
jgi:hypothetical protein